MSTIREKLEELKGVIDNTYGKISDCQMAVAEAEDHIDYAYNEILNAMAAVDDIIEEIEIQEEERKEALPLKPKRKRARP